MEEENYQHRIKVKDIVAVKSQNEKELKHKQRVKAREESLQRQLVNSRKSEVLASKLDMVASLLADEEEILASKEFSYN